MQWITLGEGKPRFRKPDTSNRLILPAFVPMDTFSLLAEQGTHDISTSLAICYKTSL